VVIADRVRAHAYPTLPGRYYHDPETFRLEQERIFAACWVFVERADHLATPGGYLLASVAGESIIVLRDRAGELRAFRAGGQYGTNERHIGDFDRYVLTALGHAEPQT
jgi:hypothetical protein